MIPQSTTLAERIEALQKAIIEVKCKIEEDGNL